MEGRRKVLKNAAQLSFSMATRGFRAVAAAVTFFQ